MDKSKNGIILALGHYGLYYDFAGFNFISKSTLACIYKMNNEWLEKFIYKSSKYGSNILPIRHDQLGKLMNTKNEIIMIPCDQKANTKKKKINFLNQETNFHYSIVDIHKITKRSLWLYLPYYDFDKKKINIKLIPIAREYNIKNSKSDILQKLATELTKEILQNPDQYFWIHDRFKSGLK